jgi:glycosyltransferase involved in cell wall biosynthesis
VKLLFVTGSLVHGGAERHTIGLANRLAERGHDCHFSYVRNDPSQLSRLRLGPGRVDCLHAARYFDPRAIGALRRRVRELRPDVVVAANPYALAYAALSRAGAPLLTVLHSTRVRSLKEGLQMLAYRPLFWRASCAVFVCEAQRRHWRRRGLFAQRNEVIYNGVDIDHWKPWITRGSLRQRLGFDDTDLVVGLCAVLRPEKNPLLLVEALALLRRRALPARVLMIGDGPLRGAVEARARELGVAHALSITGLQQDVRPWLAACDALALPSHTEAFSLAAIEAMALGVPVAHADVGGGAEMIDAGRTGFLFPPGDAHALAERLARLADGAARKRVGAAARAAVVTRFSERAMVDRYEQTLTELASTRSNHGNHRSAAGAH